MGNSTGNLNSRKANVKEEFVWEWKNSDGDWEKMDPQLSGALELQFSNPSQSINILDMQGWDFDLVKMVAIKDGNSQKPFRRKALLDFLPLQKTVGKGENGTLNPDLLEEHKDLVNFVNGISEEKDSTSLENHKLKIQNDELMLSLQEAIQAREDAISTKESALEALKIKNAEIDRMREIAEQVEEMKKELEKKREEVKALGSMNGELRLKLSTELKELGVMLRPKVEETEELKAKVKSLTLDLQDKEREIDILKSSPNSPVGTPRSQSQSQLQTLNHTPRSQSQSQSQSQPQTQNQTPVNKDFLRAASPKASMTSPRLNTTSKGTAFSKSSFALEVTPPTQKLTDTNGSKRKSQQSARALPSPTSAVAQFQTVSPRSHEITLNYDRIGSSNVHQPRKSKVLPATNSTPRGHDDLSGNEAKKFTSEIEELKDKLTKTENKMRFIEGELEVEKLRIINLKIEMAGRDKEIELIRQQKASLKDELNEQIHINQELSDKVTVKSEKLVRCERKLEKFKSEGIDIGESDNDTDNEDDDEDNIYKIDQLLRTVEELKEECKSLQDANTNLSDINSQLTQQLQHLENEKSQIESTFSKISADLKEKDKELHALKSTQKEVYSSKIFKALAEEAHTEKSKALMLGNKVKMLTDQLKEKEKDVESVKQELKNVNLNSSSLSNPEYLSLKAELEEEKNKTSSLQQEIEDLKIKIQQLSEPPNLPAEVSPPKDVDELEALKNMITQLNTSILDKDKQIEQLKSNTAVQKADKVFKALAEELQAARSQSLVLNKQVSDYKALLEEKEKEIQKLNDLLKEKELS
eukprot:TRINITY_DN10977_c0_g1_i2.p2 TRINITY_DN10977_c0_g1~~TRINITY_DN10977_c0_g1_i2.p2  ORF type:complete len:828 (-),score=264.85 TRINITY_DN10977_c0_g1_i2:3512-5947(-)